MSARIEGQPYMGFVGVSTRGSSIQSVFPRWARLLGLPTERLVGHDLAPRSAPGRYRDLVRRIQADDDCLGALVTTHKVDVHHAAADLFDELDPLAGDFHEVSSIYKRSGRLIGAARDPLTVRLALAEFVPDGYFARTGGHVLCLGSGGAGMALTHQLGVGPDRPERVICTALTRADLNGVRSLHERSGLDAGRFSYVCTPEPEDADAQLAALPPGSLVVNATGLGKDRPGSPLSDAAVFPARGLVWEFNYRGSLEFLHQAQRQRRARGLRIEDGWRYFVHGWSRGVADVFDLPMPPERVEQLAHEAELAR